MEPSVHPDTYYVQVPKGKRKITFITSTDSISFTPSYGQTCDFIILYNKKDSCHIRISANYQGVFSAVNTQSTNNHVDTIPFFMQGSRMYFKGILNGKRNFNVQFDLGAGVSVINQKTIRRAGLKFDGVTVLTNTNGTTQAPTSSSNTLEIAGLKWEKIPFVQVDNMEDYEDLIIGNQFFEKKVIQIDYDKKIMILTDSLGSLPKGYSAHELIYYQHRPRFMVNIKVGEKYYPYHFLFDTGREGTMLIGEDFTTEYNLWDRYQSIFSFGKKKIVVIPAVKIGNRTFRQILTNANDPTHPTGKQSLLGNQILNQFNLILDNPNGIIYLKPNNNQNENYATYDQFKIQLITYGLGLLAIIIVAIFLIRLYIKRLRDSKKKKGTLIP